MEKEMRHSKTSTMFYKVLTSMVLILGLCMSLEAKRFEEAECRPRPVPVLVSSEYQYKPYHVVLHQCTGTYKMISPTIKKCTPIEEHDVTVDVLNEHGSEVTVTLQNHTKCGGECTISSCAKNMYMRDCKCHCFPGSKDCPSQSAGQVSKSGRKDNTQTTIPLPYMIGMAAVGLFAVIVLVFDAMLCVRNKGFMHTIKHSCCGKSSQYTDENKNQHPENQEMVPNGKTTTDV